MVLPIDRDPPSRRLALVRWSSADGRWFLVFAARTLSTPRLRRRLEERAREQLSDVPWRILDVTSRRDGVLAAVDRLAPPGGEPVQLSLLRE